MYQEVKPPFPILVNGGFGGYGSCADKSPLRVDEQLEAKLKEKEAVIAKLAQQLAGLKKAEPGVLPRNTKPKDDDETIELVKEANRMKDRLQGIASAGVELPKNVAPELRTTVPSSSKKRPAASDPAGSRKRVEEDPENEKSCQTQ